MTCIIMIEFTSIFYFI